MANERERIAVNIPVTACARIFCSSCYVSSERDKLFAWGKVVPPARATLPAEVRQLALPPPLRVVSPFRDEFTTSCKRRKGCGYSSWWITIKAKFNFPFVSRCTREWCRSRRFDCILLVFFKRWGLKHDALLWLVISTTKRRRRPH